MNRTRKVWDVSEFANVNLPEVVGKVDPATFAQFNGIRVLDMPIHMPKQGWAIPKELAQFIEPIQLAIQSEMEFGELEDYYVYITVDQKVVHEGKTGRRAGAHSDAYIESAGAQVDLTHKTADVIANEGGEVSHTYVICDKFSTEFFDVPFPLTNTSCEGSLKTFDEIADASPAVTYDPFTLLRMDPYVVHRCVICTETTERTFVKISVSRKRYARKGNTVNKAFTYDWHLSARFPSERNHPWA